MIVLANECVEVTRDRKLVAISECFFFDGASRFLSHDTGQDLLEHLIRHVTLINDNFFQTIRKIVLVPNEILFDRLGLRQVDASVVQILVAISEVNQSRVDDVLLAILLALFVKLHVRFHDVVVLVLLSYILLLDDLIKLMFLSGSGEHLVEIADFTADMVRYMFNLVADDFTVANMGAQVVIVVRHPLDDVTKVIISELVDAKLHILGLDRWCFTRRQ